MKLLPAILLFLVFCTGVAEAGAEQQINERLKAGGTVYLQAGVYEIEGPIIIGSNTILTGSPDAVILVSPSSSQYFTGMTGIISSYGPVDNIEISGFQIDGNCDELPASYANLAPQYDHDAERAIIINGYTNQFCNNIVVKGMTIFDCFSDAVHIRFANNVFVYDNFISNCQHEGVFFTSIINGEIYNNKIAGITSDCLRLDNCVNNKVHDNVLFSYTGNHNNGAYKTGQAGVQVANAGSSHGYDASNKPTTTTNVEVFDNVFANDVLNTIWVHSIDESQVYLHDNRRIDGTELANMGIPVGDLSGNVSYTNPPTKEMSERIFSSLFDILSLSFVDSGNSTSPNVYPETNWEEKGKSKAWVDIVGWNNLTERNGVFFIPAGEQPIIKHGAENTAGRPRSTDTTLALMGDNGTLTADLEVKAVYVVAKRSTKTVNGLSLSSVTFDQKSQVSHYFDSEPIPETYKPAINATAYVTILNNSMAPQTKIAVPASPDVMKVSFVYNNTETWHYLHTGTENRTAKGVNYVQISDLNYWNGTSVSRMGDTLVLPGALDPKKVESLVKITQFDVYGKEVPVTDYQIEVKNQEEKKLINPGTLLFSGIVGIFVIGIFKIAGVIL